MYNTRIYIYCRDFTSHCFCEVEARRKKIDHDLGNVTKSVWTCKQVLLKAGLTFCTLELRKKKKIRCRE